MKALAQDGSCGAAWVEPTSMMVLTATAVVVAALHLSCNINIYTWTADSEIFEIGIYFYIFTE